LPSIADSPEHLRGARILYLTGSESEARRISAVSPEWLHRGPRKAAKTVESAGFEKIAITSTSPRCEPPRWPRNRGV